MFSDNFVNARPPARLEIGRVIGLGFVAVGRDWPTLALLGTVLYGLPSAARDYLTQWFIAHPHFTAATLWAGGLSIAQTLTALPLLTAVVAWRIHERDGGRKPGLAASVAATVGVLFWVLGVYLLYFLMMVAGLILLIVPGIIAAVTFGTAVPACVVERLNVRAALTRSLRLTRGQRLRIFIVQILVGLMLVVFSVFSGLVINLAIGLFPSLQIDVRAWNLGVTSAVSAVVGSSITACTYLELRAVKEGAAAQDVAAIFA